MPPQPVLQRRLLAGSVGPERRPLRPDPAEPRWFEALHVRDPRTAREHLAAQVSAGADVVVAPTWQTHRRVLLAAGETRQARAWTAAAVDIGREAVEIGLERRDSSAAGTDDRETLDAAVGESEPRPGTPVILPGLRPTPLLAASLPALDETPEPGTGRLLPRQAASERDYRDQAGVLADAAPDLILVEGQATIAEARLAVEAALDTGLPVWAALTGVDGNDDASVRLIDALGGLALDGLLLPGIPADQLPTLPAIWGGLIGTSATDATSSESASAWLDAGSVVIGLLDAATPRRLVPLRAAIDRVEATVLQAAREGDERWWGHVRRAAAMAEGGPALWLQSADAHTPSAEQLPGGFDWLVVPADEARLLPEGRFRLVVSPSADLGGDGSWARLLGHGGILASLGVPRPIGASGLRVVSIDDEGSPSMAILRREP